jgi:hypothetical protein
VKLRTIQGLAWRKLVETAVQAGAELKDAPPGGG